MIFGRFLRFPSLVTKGGQREVSGNLDIDFQISWFPSFYRFLLVSAGFSGGETSETEMLKY